MEKLVKGFVKVFSTSGEELGIIPRAHWEANEFSDLSCKGRIAHCEPYKMNKQHCFARWHKFLEDD